MASWAIGEQPEVAVYVNGEHAGSVSPGDTLVEVVNRYARERGIQNAAVSSNGTKLTPAQGRQTLAALGVSELTITTKDQRA